MVVRLQDHVLQCIKDQNGNHVIQRCIERIPAPRNQPVVTPFLTNLVSLSSHPYGCRVVQRLLEHATDEQRQPVLDEILTNATELSQNQYGNYVIQHVLEHGTPEHRSRVAAAVQANVVDLARHKFASNVVEKLLVYGNRDDRQLVLDEICDTAGNSGADQPEVTGNPSPTGSDKSKRSKPPLLLLMRDQFGNYVIQRLLDTIDDDQVPELVNQIHQVTPSLKRLQYSKHIIARIEQRTQKQQRHQQQARTYPHGGFAPKTAFNASSMAPLVDADVAGP